LEPSEVTKFSPIFDTITASITVTATVSVTAQAGRGNGAEAIRTETVYQDRFLTTTTSIRSTITSTLRLPAAWTSTSLVTVTAPNPAAKDMLGMEIQAAAPVTVTKVGAAGTITQRVIQRVPTTVTQQRISTVTRQAVQQRPVTITQQRISTVIQRVQARPSTVTIQRVATVTRQAGQQRPSTVTSRVVQLRTTTITRQRISLVTTKEVRTATVTKKI
jgi:hypothetical protein